tara:strand:- start:232 stop:405 length:174 start_codon:yes stop_codon:yes gene_type:complete
MALVRQLIGIVVFAAWWLFVGSVIIGISLAIISFIWPLLVLLLVLVIGYAIYESFKK